MRIRRRLSKIAMNQFKGNLKAIGKVRLVEQVVDARSVAAHLSSHVRCFECKKVGTSYEDSVGDGASHLPSCSHSDAFDVNVKNLGSCMIDVINSVIGVALKENETLVLSGVESRNR